MKRILGIDPGSRVTGYGLIECSANQIQYVASGSIRLSEGDLPHRLFRIFDGISAVIDQYQPDLAAIEKVFVSINPQSALKIGHARGSAICACAAKDVEVAEYAAREIKQSVTGTGAADKDQVKFMVLMLLGLQKLKTQDEADALAVAITHYQHSPLLESLPGPYRRDTPSGPTASVTG